MSVPSQLIPGKTTQHPSETVTYPIDTSKNGTATPSGVTLRAYDRSDWSPVTPSTFTSAVTTTTISVTIGGLSDDINYRIEVEYTKGTDVLVDFFDLKTENYRG